MDKYPAWLTDKSLKPSERLQARWKAEVGARRKATKRSRPFARGMRAGTSRFPQLIAHDGQRGRKIHTSVSG